MYTEVKMVYNAKRHCQIPCSLWLIYNAFCRSAENVVRVCMVSIDTCPADMMLSQAWAMHWTCSETIHAITVLFLITQTLYSPAKESLNPLNMTLSTIQMSSRRHSPKSSLYALQREITGALTVARSVAS
jgi:hypothetical protein